MKSNICITVTFLAGTDIDKAIIEAKEKAILWNVAFVCFDFNNINCSISQTCDVEVAISKFHKLRNLKGTQYLVE
jgi:hypothetical protein